MSANRNVRIVRPRRHITIWADVSGSEDEMTRDSLGKASLPCDSRSYLEAISSLDNSQASLNKRLASVAGFDDKRGPTDFDFLLENGMQADGRDVISDVSADASLTDVSADAPASFQAVVDALVAKEPPATFDADGLHWVNSRVTKSSELIDGQGWIAEFERRVAEARANPRNATIREAVLRNRVLKDMGSISPPGRKVLLDTGQEVIFWFNVGPAGPPRSRVHVTEARCPHQQVCLLGSELMEIEDLASGRRALTRCPRHNKRFDLSSGESLGNVEQLRCYPSRFEHGCWYVGISPAQATTTPGAQSLCVDRAGDGIPINAGGKAGVCTAPDRLFATPQVVRKKARVSSRAVAGSSDDVAPPP